MNPSANAIAVVPGFESKKIKMPIASQAAGTVEEDDAFAAYLNRTEL
jgi:hypothetical protein